MPQNSSSNEKLVNGKNPIKPILQFTVTPPRQSGPSEAERKIEALTQQLEEEFEKEEESEYFGKFKGLNIFYTQFSISMKTCYKRQAFYTDD